MKKLLVLLLLISVGLNLGLGLTLLRNQTPVPFFSERRGPDGGPSPERGAPPRGGPGQGRPFGKDFLEKKLRFLDDRLGLDDAQMDSLRQLHEDSSTQFRQQAEKVRRARLQLRQAAASPKQEDLRSLIADVGRQQARLDSLVTEVMFQELGILDQEQRQKYLGLMPADRFEGRFGGKPRGRGHPPRGQ